MANPSKKRRTRSKSTTATRRLRAKNARKASADIKAEEGPEKSPSGQEAQAVVPEQSVAEEFAPGEPVPQPGMNTSLLPEEAPNIVTGYVRLITLGLSFFLAVYLGLEAFSLFVQFPARLPISSLLINDAHLSSSQAAYSLVGLLFAELAIVQVWAWKTRRAGLTYEEMEGEAVEPVVAGPSTSQNPEVAPASVPSSSTPPESLVQPPLEAGTVYSESLKPPDSPAVTIPQPPEVPEVNLASPVPTITDDNTAPLAPSRPPEAGDPAPVQTEAQSKTQEQKSGMATQFQPHSGGAEPVGPEPTVVTQPSTTPNAAAASTVPPIWQVPAVSTQSAQLRQQESSEAVSAEEPLLVRYPIFPDNPDVYVGIQRDKETGGYRYVVVEPRLTHYEREVYQRLTRLMVDELEVDMAKLKNNKLAENYLIQEAKVLSKKYKISVSPDAYKKIAYYFARDYLKMGKIDVLMNDPRIEDISCDGPRVPLYIWHRDYESIPTNVVFQGDEELNTFASKLAYISGKHISIASPIVDATLPDGSRIQITYGKEVTKKGSTFTIRKFKGDPITIVDLLKYNTLSPELGAYLWYLIEKRMSLLVAGGTASGKSIPYDEKVFVYKSGTPRLVSIGKLYDETSGSSIARREKEYEILDVSDIETAAFDQNLKIGRFAVSSVVRHRSDKTIFRVKTRSGREVRTTGDHSVFTIIDGAVVPYPTSRLGPGMFVGVPRVVPAPTRSRGEIDLVQLFAQKDHGLYVENIAPYAEASVESIGLEATASALRVRARDLKASIARGFVTARVEAFASLAAAASLDLSSERDLRIRPKTNASQGLPSIVPVTPALMRLLGYWTAEGMYQRGVTLFQLDQAVRDDMSRLAREVFGVPTHENRGDRTRLDINSTVARAFLKELFQAEGGSGNKRIPDLVLEQPNDFLAEFLRGYFTGDGWGDRYVEASTKSLELAQQLVFALSRFAIVAVTNPKIVNGITYHRVLVYGQGNVASFARQIGFLNKFQHRLVERSEERVSPHTNVDTIPGVGSLLKKALAFKSGSEKKELWSDWHSYWSAGSSKSIGPETMVKFAEESGAEGGVREAILTLAYSDIFWDEVVEVEEVPYSGEYVYDLEVPGAQNFVGGAGGVFLHNTTTLNALSMFIPPDQKIVSVEDTPELNLSHKNWIQSVTRGGGVAGEITLFDLLKAAMRQRPDIIVVGEVRGAEAFTLFQAIATGHGGLGTVHADSVEAAINRLTTEPMNVPKSLLGSTLDCLIMQLRIKMKDKSVRRMVHVAEIVGHESSTDQIVLNNVFKWDPITDKYVFGGRSRLFDKITKRYGTPPEKIRQDIEDRKIFLRWLSTQNLRDYRDLSQQIRDFYADPNLAVEKAMGDLGKDPV